MATTPEDAERHLDATHVYRGGGVRAPTRPVRPEDYAMMGQAYLIKRRRQEQANPLQQLQAVQAARSHLDAQGAPRKGEPREIDVCQSGQCERLRYCPTPDRGLVPEKKSRGALAVKVILAGFAVGFIIALVRRIFV